jgi:hypothetical protein
LYDFWDANAHLLYHFFGYAEDEILGRHVIGTIVPFTESGGRDLAGLMAEICAAPETFEQNINENMRRNGERVWIAWTNRIVRDAAVIGSEHQHRYHRTQTCRSSTPGKDAVSKTVRLCAGRHRDRRSTKLPGCQCQHVQDAGLQPREFIGLHASDILVAMNCRASPQGNPIMAIISANGVSATGRLYFRCRSPGHPDARRQYSEDDSRWPRKRRRKLRQKAVSQVARPFRASG